MRPVTEADDPDDQHEAAAVVFDDSAPAAEISTEEMAFDQWSAAQPQRDVDADLESNLKTYFAVRRRAKWLQKLPVPTDAVKRKHHEFDVVCCMRSYEHARKRAYKAVNERGYTGPWHADFAPIYACNRDRDGKYSWT